MLTNTFFIIIEKWAFEDLHVGGFIPASTPLEEPFVESGLEVMSPHKSLAITQEVNDSIPEIGVVSTAWIGHLGKQVLLKRVRDETAKSVSKCLHSELRALASASMKAFETLHWADYSTNCDVSNAVKLCRSYLSTPSRRLYLKLILHQRQEHGKRAVVIMNPIQIECNLLLMFLESN